MRFEEAGCAVLLPAKPAKMTRTIHLEALKVEMTMIGAQVREVAYTVGGIALGQPDEVAMRQALAAMRAAMVRNIAGTEQASRPVRIARTDAAGAVRGHLDGVEIEALGRMREREARLLARFVGVPGFVWQAVVLGERPEPQASAQFLESLKVMR